MDREHGRERCMKITCNEKALWITKTLHSALLQLRRIIMSKMAAEEQGLKYLETLPEPRSKYVWIDQLSINQQDLAERSSQIPLMNKIFASAQYVFAWIGDMDDLGLGGFTATIARAHRTPGADRPLNRASWMVMGNARKELYAFAVLLSRQWFRRAWVCQEAIYARRLYLWIGPLFMDWWNLIAALQTIDDIDIMSMACFMGSLVRREPTVRLSRKLARIQTQSTEEDVSPDTVTDVELLNNIKGAISCIQGVVELKKAAWSAVLRSRSQEENTKASRRTRRAI
jgi:hypothetical protein